VSESKSLDTHQKALSLNLDPLIFGSFAEIGAGQEVARWFFLVGAASGTVAKTVSAYDKEVSDDIYGAGTRYVSQPRLLSMLEHEWTQLLLQLNDTRGATTRFFSFVDTVSARNFKGDNECHGWIGLRFQTQPKGPPSDVILHVNLRDNTNQAQQEAVGILGVNLIYAAFFHLSSPEEFIVQVAAELSRQRIEIDYVELKGPAFRQWDSRLIQVSLIANNLAEAVVFPEDGQPMPPTDILYKKLIVLAPGRFNAVTAFQKQMIETTLVSLPKQELAKGKRSIGFVCLSYADMVANQPALTAAQILESVDTAQKFGSGTLLFRQRELYKMGAYVNRYTKARIYFAAGLSVLIRAMLDNYDDLDGSLLEGIARLFRENVRLSVFPMPVAAMKELQEITTATGWKWKETNGQFGARDIEPNEPLNHLYHYLLAKEFIVPNDLSSR
jgi:hypothetical protein